MYELIDKVLCLIYLVNYVLKIFISQNRCQYFIESESIKDLMVIVPVIIYDYDCGQFGLFMKAVSRVVRLSKFDLFFGMIVNENDESNVVQKSQ